VKGPKLANGSWGGGLTLGLLLGLLLGPLGSLTLAATWDVTNTNDSGAGSLRQAISSSSDDDTIAFQTGGPTPQTINLTGGGIMMKPLNFETFADSNVTVTANAYTLSTFSSGHYSFNSSDGLLTLAATASGGTYAAPLHFGSGATIDSLNCNLTTTVTGSVPGNAYGINAEGDLSIASLPHGYSISATAASGSAYGIYSNGSLTISGGTAGTIEAHSSAGALGMFAEGDLTISGPVSGDVSAEGSNVAAIYGNHSVIITDGITGHVSASSTTSTIMSFASAIYSHGAINGGSASTPCEISGTVSADGFKDVYTICGNGMNIKLDSTGSLLATCSGGAASAIQASGSADSTVELVAGCTVVGNIALGSGTSDALTFSGSTGSTTYNGNISGVETINATGGTWNLGGVISDATAVDINGATLTLSGNNTYTGPTTVTTGTLVVNGALASTVTVGQGGTLGGNGTLGGLVVNGTVAPGNSIGTLTVNGNYTHNAGATYVVEINDHGQSDLIHATGTATISGGTVDVQAQSGTYTAGMTYRILEASGVSGTFHDVTDNLPFLNGELVYGSDYIDLLLVRSHVPFADVAQTRNQFATATYLDSLYDSAAGDLSTVMGALNALSAPDAREAFDHLSGEPYADLAAVDLNAANLFTDTAFYRLYNGADLDCASPPGRRFWAYGVGNWERQRATGADWNSYYGYSNQLAGFMVGYDNQFDNVLLGFGSGYGQSRVGYISDPASDKTDLFNFSLYAKADVGAAYMAGVVGYTHGWNDMTRTIAIEGLDTRQATASVGGNVFGTLLQAGYNIEHGRWRLTPIIGLRYGYGGMCDSTETGADSVDLAVGGTHRSSLVGHVGGRLAFCATSKWRAEAYGQWEHEYCDVYNDVTMAFADSPGEFMIRSAVAERDAARTGIVAIGQLNRRVSLHLNYDALLRSSYSSQQLAGGLSIGF
jgi:autotransporter-associated beta strand protein